jgi:sialidase-1
MSYKITKLISDQVICKEPGRYIGWPTVVKTKDNVLLASFSGDRDQHVCPFGKLQLIKSMDFGKNWTAPVTIANTPLDDRDSGIIETKQGTLVASWFTSVAFDRPHNRVEKWKRLTENISNDTRRDLLGSWTIRSSDGGNNWDKPVRAIASTPHGPIELEDGRLLYVGIDRGHERHRLLVVEESIDDGKSWNLLSLIPIPKGENPKRFCEPHVIEVEEGKLIALIRYHGTKYDGFNVEDPTEDCYMRQSESIDGGYTWSLPEKTVLKGFPPHLLKLKNGWLLASYCVRYKPDFGQRACISKDNGKTWDIDNEIIIAGSKNRDLGYPASVQLDDGSIYTVYYQIDRQGEQTSLMATHWKLD